MRNLITIVFVLCIYISCKVPAAPSVSRDNKVVKGSLSNSQYKLVNQALQSILGRSVKETLFIKYNIVKDDCYKFSDRMVDDALANLVRQEIASINKINVYYPDVTASNLREVGHNFSRFIKWNDSIRVDQNGAIFKSLFQGRYTCGSTAIVFPNKTFILVNGDNNFAALQFLK
jgi:hypothetical protein